MSKCSLPGVVYPGQLFAGSVFYLHLVGWNKAGIMGENPDT